MGAIYILWLRQLKRYFRSKSRVVGSLGQPLLFLVALGYGFGPIFQRAGGGNYLEFLVPGIISMGVLFTSIFMGIEVVWDRQFGFLKETLVAPVSRFQIMVGRTIGGATVAAIQGLIVFFLTLLLGFKIHNIILLPAAFLFMLLIAILFTALGTAIASRMEDFHGFQLVTNFLVMPLFFLSGALFPLKGLPESIALITKIDPLSYGVDGLRDTLTGVGNFGLWYNFALLSLMALILFAIGSYLFSKIEV